MGNRAFEGFVGQNRHRTFAEGMTTFAQGGLRQVLKSPYEMCRLHPALGQYRLLLELLSETKDSTTRHQRGLASLCRCECPLDPDPQASVLQRRRRRGDEGVRQLVPIRWTSL